MKRVKIKEEKIDWGTVICFLLFPLILILPIFLLFVHSPGQFFAFIAGGIATFLYCFEYHLVFEDSFYGDPFHETVEKEVEVLEEDE